MPIYINAEHAERARPYFRASVCKILGISKFSPMETLKLLPKLMNTMVVSVMNSKIHASIKALEGYVLCLSFLYLMMT